MQKEDVQGNGAVIKDFSLFAAEDAAEKLQDVLEQWLEWQ